MMQVKSPADQLNYLCVHLSPPMPVQKVLPLPLVCPNRQAVRDVAAASSEARHASIFHPEAG